jgi:putative endopeptidase
MKTSWSALLIFTSSLLALPGFAKGPAKPSSEIPARREFPINEKISPCEDFHQFVCSNAEASFKLRDDRNYHAFAFSDSSERILETKKTFMANLAKAKDLDPRAQQAQDFYLSCLNTKGRAEQEKALVTQTLKEVEGIKGAADFFTYMHSEPGTRLGGIFGLFPSNNVDNPDKVDATIMSDIMLLPEHDYYEKADVVSAEIDLLTEFFKTIEPKIKTTDAKKRAENVMAMQKDYVKIYPRPAIQRQRWGEKRTMTQAEFLKKFANIQPQIMMGYLPEKTLANIPLPESLDFLNNEFGKYEIQVWKDIALIDTLLERLDEGYPKFYKKNFDMNKKFFGGPVKRSPLEERCTKIVGRNFNKEIDEALFEKVFPNFQEQKVTEVGEKIRASIIEGLERNKWLSSSAKKGALAKIKDARLQMVKPKNDREWDFVPQRNYSKTDYIQNSRTYQEARWAKNMQELREPANKDSWGMGPLTVNAYYNPSENKFVLPAGILQYPFFDGNGTLIENLGAVGAVIGHELGHGIDDQGSRYDSKGRLNAWMSTKDIMEFNLRGQKMIDQFNKAGLDGRLTLGENVADLVGLTFAYHAAFPKDKGTVAEKQSFFKSYARLWCQVARPDFMEMLKKTDPHSDGKSRINEQVKHQPAFAEVFSCKAGDKMVLPEAERISIW